MIEREETWAALSFSDRMATTEFRVHERPHIVVDGKACLDCSTKACVVACPAALFVPTSDGGIVFNYEQCFECGTCYLVCNKEGAITWSYPDGGFGVVFPEHLMIAVCLKWVGDRTISGVSAADEAALEVALRHGEVTRSSVIAVCVGPSTADRCLRNAVAVGATTAIRVEAADDMDSASVAAALGPVVAHSTAVWCGDSSIDRGSGSVPAFLADVLERQQALGLIDVEFSEPMRVIRRLDGGRREVLGITGRAVLSVEGSIARLRRAPLRAALNAQATEVLPYGTLSKPLGAPTPIAVRPYRPRARVLAAPAGATALDRLRVLTDTSAAPQAGEIVEAGPIEAARRIIEALTHWGYL